VPWWSWILIWVALGACALVVLLLGALYLFRKVAALVRGAGEALEQVTVRTGPEMAGVVADGAPSVHGDGPAAPAARPGSAVFADPARMRREYEDGRERRRLARRDRRVARRRERGQMQSLRDLGLN
jgi:pyruvate/2-oxoglutarate dehydrogenase complex dihydrolipoamide acyltransferase (E2) component